MYSRYNKPADGSYPDDATKPGDINVSDQAFEPVTETQAKFHKLEASGYTAAQMMSSANHNSKELSSLGFGH